jgi:hypothetical protein
MSFMGIVGGEEYYSESAMTACALVQAKKRAMGRAEKREQAPALQIR